MPHEHRTYGIREDLRSSGGSGLVRFTRAGGTSR